VPRGFEHDGGGRHFGARYQQLILVNDGERGRGEWIVGAGGGAEFDGVLLCVGVAGVVGCGGVNWREPPPSGKARRK